MIELREAMKQSLLAFLRANNNNHFRLAALFLEQWALYYNAATFGVTEGIIERLDAASLEISAILDDMETWN